MYQFQHNNGQDYYFTRNKINILNISNMNFSWWLDYVIKK